MMQSTALICNHRFVLLTDRSYIGQVAGWGGNPFDRPMDIGRESAAVSSPVNVDIVLYTNTQVMSSNDNS